MNLLHILNNIVANIHINWLDIILGLIFLVVIIRGLFTGFSKAVSGLLGVIVGFWVAANQYIYISQKMAFLIKNETWRSLIAFFLLFLVVYLCFAIIGIIFRGFFSALSLSWFDKLLGAAFGFLKGLVIASVIIFILTVTLPENSALLKNSYLYPRVSHLARVMTDMVPEHIKARFMWKWRKLEKNGDVVKLLK